MQNYFYKNAIKTTRFSTNQIVTPNRSCQSDRLGLVHKPNNPDITIYIKGNYMLIDTIIYDNYLTDFLQQLKTNSGNDQHTPMRYVANPLAEIAIYATINNHQTRATRTNSAYTQQRSKQSTRYLQNNTYGCYPIGGASLDYPTVALQCRRHTKIAQNDTRTRPSRHTKKKKKRR